MSEPAPRKAAARFIFVTLLLDVLGIGLIVPVLPQLVTELVGGDPSVGARWYGPLVSLYAAMQFIFAPMLGMLSDRYGRRPVILLSLLGFGLNYLVLAFAPNLFWLVVGRLVAGFTGATITTANAYLADISTAETRSRNFGLVGAAFGLGFILGPAAGGFLGEMGLRVPFLVSAGVVLINAAYGYFVLPESLPEDKRSPINWKKANPIGSLGTLAKYPLVASLAVAFVLANLSQRGLESVWVLHGTYRYGWSELENGLTLAFIGLMLAIMQGGVIRVIVPRLGELRTIALGLSVSAVAMVGYGLADKGWMVFVVAFFGAAGSLAMPTLQGVAAGVVPQGDQGSVQGALTSVLSLTAIVAPLISTGLFSAFSGGDAVRELPGMPFFACAAFLVGALAVAMFSLRGGIPKGPVEPAT